MNTIQQKANLRKHFRQLRSQLTPQQRENKQRAISDRLIQLLQQFSVKTVASYRSFDTEVDLELLHSSAQWQFCFPKVNGNHLDFFTASSGKDFEKSQWGIWEPKVTGNDRVPLAEVDAVLVPGLAFDHRCHRIGYGRGFYDRALEQSSGLQIGVAFKVQVSLESFDVESHDLPMNYLVTEDYLLKPMMH